MKRSLKDLRRAVFLGLGGLAIFLFLLTHGTQTLLAQSESDAMYSMFEKASALRSSGSYDEAVSVLQEIMAQCSSSEIFLRRAYNDLVFTLLEKPDSVTVKLIAREALTRFPDLTADPANYPQRVTRTYEDLRKQMFGSLTVTTQPESCRVFLDDKFIGMSPVSLAFVGAGIHAVNAGKSGYRDAFAEIVIGPSGASNLPLALEKKRGLTWWAWRIGPSLLVGTAVAIAVGGNDQPAEPGPLPWPPDPPR